MNKRIFLKILVTIIIITVLSNVFCLSVSNAIGNIFKDGKDFLDADNNQVIDPDGIKPISDYIYNVLLALGIIIAIIVAMILGIQFMAASADEKAKVKEAILPFVVGCIVVFGAFTIWKVAVNIGLKAEKSAFKTQEQTGTPGISGYKCKYCKKSIGDIPSKVIVGGYDYECPNCHKKVVEKGEITGATK